MATIRIGIIGCGAIGRTHATCLAKIDAAELTAYADVHEPAARALLDTFGGRYATGDVQKLLADDAIDAVHICTRHDSHAPLAIAAAEAGKHVMIEKPLALTIEACEQIAEAVERAGTWLMPAFKMRYCPLVQMAHAFIPRPQVVVGQMMDNRWPDDLWAQDPVQGGGNVHSQGCHATDLIRYFAASEPVTIWAAGGMLTHPGHACIDQCVAAIAFENGHVGSWIQGDAGCPAFTSKFFFGLHGEGRSVQLYDRLKQATFFDGQKTWTEKRDEEEGFQLENEAFIAALVKGERPELAAHDGLAATRMVLAADRAIRTGQVQTL